MKLVEIAIDTVLRIPDGWDYFTYRGLSYRRDRFGRFVVDRVTGAKKTA
jgi:hypothetical protein